MISIEIKGWDKMQRRFNKAPKVLQIGMKKAMGKSISMVETESKRRTPVDTGLLKTSIGGPQGFRSIGTFKGILGTNVKYAVHVNYGRGSHKTGERLFMEKGLTAATPFINKTFQEIFKKI